MTTATPTHPGQDYWLIWSTPEDGIAEERFAAVVDEHLAWMLELERVGAVLCSGPLLSGPGTRPGSGVTVLRAADEPEARAIAAADPFVRHGLRRFAAHRWQLKEGSIQVRLQLGAGTHEWK